MPRERPQIILLSGAICSGKSELGKLLAEKHGALVVKTRDLVIKMRPNVKAERRALQRAGEELDRSDGGAWVATALARLVEEAREKDASKFLFVVDAIRIEAQINAVRNIYHSSVHHVHLIAEKEELEKRYKERLPELAETKTYAEVRRSKTERDIDKLHLVADTVVQTDHCSPEAVCARATALVGLYPRSVAALVDVLVGGQYGSEGKGNIIGYIAPEYEVLVRVGGPNAGHQVFGEPKPEVYYHLPSGSRRAPEAQVVLAAGAVLNVQNLLAEIQEHGLDASRLTIDPQAMTIDPADIELEKELLKAISSTGQGVGAATSRKALHRIPDNSLPEGRVKVRLARDVPELAPYIRDAQEILADAYLKGKRVLLEGTQGTSLNLHQGKYPYVTSRDTTVSGCLADAGIAPTRVRKTIMVCRTYPIRVGGPSGPMEYEISWAKIAARSGIDKDELEKKEKTTTTKKDRRVAEFDWLQLRRSALLNGPTDIALTFVDYLGVANRKAYRFEQLTEETLRFIEEIERVTGAPVSLVSTDFNWRNIIDKRSW
jgi:adenylosuccinate synthase